MANAAEEHARERLATFARALAKIGCLGPGGGRVTRTRTMNYVANLKCSAEDQVHDSNYKP